MQVEWFLFIVGTDGRWNEMIYPQKDKAKKQLNRLQMDISLVS